MKNHYDYLIVGAGLFGAVFAHEMTKRGKKCLVIDKRNHIAGNVYTEKVEGINVHRYGAHIFHTSDKKIWDYVNQFAHFNNFVNSPLAYYEGKFYNLPFNMNTFSQMWGVTTADEAKAIIAEQVVDLGIVEPKNLEEQALSLVGKDVYEKLVKGYTEKQWGRDCKDLPAFIIKRLPLRFTYDNNYFNDTYQGIPTEGYSEMVKKMLEGVDVELNISYFDFVKRNDVHWTKTIYTGAIDEFFGYKYGPLEYRSVRFETEVLDQEDYQGNAVINYTGKDVPYTRIIEHKHFEFGKQPKTIISKEFSSEWKPGVEPYYPVNDEKNEALYKRYLELAKERPDVVFGGRLGLYKYFDMDKVIASALSAADMEAAGDSFIKKIYHLLFPAGSKRRARISQFLGKRQEKANEPWTKRSDKGMHRLIALRKRGRIPADYLDAKKIQQMKNRHQGERCFIVCTGPSLRLDDLDMLKSEITFGVNSIIDAYDKTQWRPTYYCVVDRYAFEKPLANRDVPGGYSIRESFFHYRIDAKCAKDIDCKVLVDYTNHEKQNKLRLSKDISVCVYDAFTVTAMAIQIAVYMGFSKIYLLGLDNKYTKGGRHFLESDMNDNQKGIDDFSKIEEMARKGLVACKKYAEKSNVEIYNATRGGCLEVFERVDFDKILTR